MAVLRGYGATVQSLANQGGGVPDLMVGWRGRTHLIEVKNDDQDPNKQRLTADEQAWIDRWTGSPVAIVHSVTEAEAWLRSQ